MKLFRRALWPLVILAFALHHDLWFWDDPRRFIGLPVGLAYHVVFCVAVSLLMALAVRYAWPGERR